MPTLTLRVKEDSLHKLFELLNQLPEVEVIESETVFHANKAYLNEAFQNMLAGKNRVVSQEELERNIEEIILKHEN